HEVGCVELSLVADADSEPGKRFGAKVGGNIAESFLTAVGAAGPDPDLSHGEAQVVAHGQDVLRLELVEPSRLTDRPTAQVHEGFRLQQQDAAIIDLDLGHLS